MHTTVDTGTRDPARNGRSRSPSRARGADRVQAPTRQARTPRRQASPPGRSRRGRDRDEYPVNNAEKSSRSRNRDTLAPARREAASQLQAARSRSAPRTPFILLVLGLLGGGMLCLLVINTTLAAGSFRISNLHKSTAADIQREQILQHEVAKEQSPASIARRAYRLGMRSQATLNFIDLRSGRTYTQPARVAGVTPVPGYTP